MGVEILKRGAGPVSGSAVITARSVGLSPYDPIKDHVGQKLSRQITGRPVATILDGTAGSNEARIVNAGALPRRGPASAAALRRTPSLARRSYQPTIIT